MDLLHNGEGIADVAGSALGLLKFDDKGLIPAITQDVNTGRVLILGYMNREALEISIREKRVCFYSRSRGCLWRKGETSGNFLPIHNITADCEYNSLLIGVTPAGPACHTGAESCFYNTVSGEPADTEGASADGVTEDVTADGVTKGAAADGVTEDVAADGGAAGGVSIQALFDLVAARKAEMPEGSYTTYLFDKGIEKILKKVGEESSEVIIASMKNNKDEIVYETADLCYHILVLLCEAGIKPVEIIGELERRHKKDG